jgi:hypothetical protein
MKPENNPTKSRPQPTTLNDYFERLPESTQRSLKVWITLSENDRAAFDDAIRTINGQSDSTRALLPDIITNIPLSPWESPPACPYCGRD